jgi:TolB protein
MYRLLFFSFLILFTVGCNGGGASGVYFLRAGDAGAAQLFFLPDGAAQPEQLTGVDDPTAPEVIDYAVTPDGERIVYAVLAGVDSALRVVEPSGRNDDELLVCPAAECAGPVWSPDGRRLVYERRPWVDGAFGSPRLYWLDTDTGETLPLIEGNETPGYGARFSPDGAWLSYVSVADDGIVLYRLETGAQRLLGSLVGSPAAWSPDSAAVVYGDLVVQAHETAPEVGEGETGGETPLQESSSTLLYRALVDGDSPRQRLSPDAAVADSVPAYSPDGQWIAFGRAPADTNAGRQLWLMRPDGGEARALTADPAATHEVTHGPPSWSPDGRYLLFQRYDPVTESSSVWRLEVGTGEMTLLAEGGYLPAWGS